MKKENDFRPYKDCSEVYLIDEHHKLSTHRGIWFNLLLVSIGTSLLWLYLRIGFYIFIAFVILLLFYQPDFDKEKLLLGELKRRG